MIRRLHTQGYKTLRDVDLPLGPLNVLIGPNGCGKTNLLDIAALLHEHKAGKLEDAIFARGGLDGILWARGEYKSIRIQLIYNASREGEYKDWEFRLRLRRKETTFVPETEFGLSNTLEIFRDLPPLSAPPQELEFDEDSFSDLSQLPKDGSPYSEAKRELDSLFAGIAIYTSFDTTRDSPMRQPPLVRPQTRLINGGDNLVNVLYRLSALREYRPVYEDILDVIRTAYPDFEELSFPPEGGDGRIVMRWKEKSFKRDFSTHYLSDGILRFLCLLAVLKTPDPPPLVCIDEPELGLHPSLMPIIAALLRDASSRTQLIIATHSPQLVDALDVEHIVIMDRVDGETRVQRLQERPQLDAWLEHYTKGELWLSGELGGMPW
jgi:predicted ATPase